MFYKQIFGVLDGQFFPGPEFVGVLHILRKFCWGTALFWAILLGHDTFLKNLKMCSGLSVGLFMTGP